MNTKVIGLMIALFVIGLLVGFGGGASMEKTPALPTATIVTETVTHMKTVTTTLTITQTVTVTQTLPATTTTTTTAQGQTFKLGQPIVVSLGGTKYFEITVFDVRIGKYVHPIDSSTYYSAKDGYKVVAVRVRIKNIGNEIRNNPINSAVLTTDKGGSYDNEYAYQLKWYYLVPPPDETIVVDEIDRYADIAPGAALEGDYLFEIKEDENPTTLWLEVDISIWYNPITLQIDLTQTT